MARWGPTAPEAVPSACIQLGQTARAESCFSATVKRRLGLSSVPPLLGYSPEASGTATTGEMRPRKVGHWPLWRRQRFQRRARAICSHEWTPPAWSSTHPSCRASQSSYFAPPEKSCTSGRRTGAGLGGIGISAEVDFDELADFAVEVDFVICRGVRITSATCRQGR